MSVHKYIRLRSGIKFYFNRPTVAQINLADIVWSLSRLPRFLGHTNSDLPYTVLQHLVWCHDHADKDVQKEVLCHDFSESLMQDLPTPLKVLVPQYRDIERRIERVIARKFKLRYPFPAAVKSVDVLALVSEMRWLTNRKDYKDFALDPVKTPIVPWTPKKSRREFMKRWNLHFKS